jgi:hypothetical protein
MKTHLTGAAVLLIAGIGAAAAQTVPRDRPDAHAVDVAKVATVEQWSKRRGAKVIWGSDPQPLQNTSAAEPPSRVDAGKVGTVEQQARERGHREMWFKYPQLRADATASKSRPATATAVQKSAARQPAATATNGARQP